MPGGPWNDTTDKQLLLTIIHLTAPQLPKWDQAASLMGEGYTSESTRQHFQKLRKESQAQFGKIGDNVTAGSGTTPKTSRKSKSKDAGETPSKSITAKRKARQTEDNIDDEESPSKKQAIKSEGEEAVAFGLDGK